MPQNEQAAHYHLNLSCIRAVPPKVSIHTATPDNVLQVVHSTRVIVLGAVSRGKYSTPLCASQSTPCDAVH